MNIKYDSRNYRKHSDKNKDLINKSLKECGAGRSIVIDNEDNIIAGNGIYEQAQKLGIKTKVIETDGSELVVVKRTDLATDDDKRKQLAVMDNSTSDSSDFDIELLRDDFEIACRIGVLILNLRLTIKKLSKMKSRKKSRPGVKVVMYGRLVNTV